MTKEEISLKADEYSKEYDGSAYYRYGFYDGAEWMQEKMQETNEGQALLYAVEKTAERTKREMIAKAVGWLKEEMHCKDHSSGRGSWGEIKALGVYDSLEEFIDEFKKSCPNIICAKATEYDVQQALKDAAFLITDYSSIFFDFAYLKKPEIFFQFDKEEFYSEHYHQSDFEHEKDAFGDVVKTVEELENKIEEYFNNNFQMEKKYIKRVEKTFAKIDKNNCKRTIEAIFKSE